MEGESDLVVSRKLYLEETPHRISGIIHDLLAMQDDCEWQMDHLLRLLREQAEASRRADYQSILRLCQSMEDCQLISEHADTIAGIAGESMEACR